LKQCYHIKSKDPSIFCYVEFTSTLKSRKRKIQFNRESVAIKNNEEAKKRTLPS
jgi:hypothetical protein